MTRHILHITTAIGIALAAMLVAACGGAEEGHLHIKGHFEHLQQATMYAYSDAPSCTKIDTIQVVNGDFEYDCLVDEPTVMTIVYPNFTEMVFIAEPTSTLKYDADVNNLRHASMTGTAANDSLTSFRKRYATESFSTQQKAAADYIRKHPADVASIALFAQYFERAEKITHKPTAALLTALRKAHSQNKSVMHLAERMQPILHTAIGANPADSLLKPHALYIFTLSAQYRSSDLRRVATECTSDSTVKLIEVSLDTMDLHTARLRYGLRNIPGSILLNEEGSVVDRDIPLERLKAAVAGAYKK